MKTFKCSYETKAGMVVDVNSYIKIEANDYSDAAEIYQEKYPSEHPRIMVVQGFKAPQYFDNNAYIQRAEEKEAHAEEKAAHAYATRIEALQTLSASAENTNWNLAELSYEDLTALIENMRDFPDMRENYGSEEYGIRERLYMKASLDSNLQALLQTDLLTKIVSHQSTAGATGPAGSNLARNAAMVGGLAALHKLNQIEENTGDVSEGLGFD